MMHVCRRTWSWCVLRLNRLLNQLLQVGTEVILRV
jgi:hypothetical protein